MTQDKKKFLQFVKCKSLKLSLSLFLSLILLSLYPTTSFFFSPATYEFVYVYVPFQKEQPPEDDASKSQWWKY